MRWREEKFEANGARVGHHLVIQRRLRRQLALGLFLGCWQLLLVPRFELRGHSGEQLVDELWLVPGLHLLRDVETTGARCGACRYLVLL